MGSMFGKLKMRFEDLLDNNYLFDRDQKRTKSDLLMFMLFLIGSSLVNTIGILANSGISSLLECLVPVALCALAAWAVWHISSTMSSMFLAAFMMLICMWVQLFFSHAGYFGVICIILYPIAICFFMGNYFAIPYLCIIFGNLLLFFSPVFNIWRGALGITADNPKGVLQEFDGSLPSQLLIAFMLSAVLSLILQYIRQRTSIHLAAFANQIAENSFKDPLTGLLTRRAFYERYGAEIIAMAESGQAVYLIMCDIDHFKAVNDTYGHAIGDEILKHASNVLLQYSMGRTLCFRWGGEEFIMFMNEKSLDKAVATANRIRVVLEHSPYIDPDVGNIKSTMSFGVHQFDTALNIDKNMTIADEYLYEAKRTGRNRVVSAMTSNPATP